MTKKEFQEHLRENCGDYNSMVSIAILYHKAYGEYPKIGMSGQQAEFAKSMENITPYSNLFEKIWQAIKHWDADTDGQGYHGITGDDVRVIIKAIMGD